MSSTRIGLCTIELSLEGVTSLRQKQAILNSLLKRLRAQFNAAAAEVEDQNMHESAVIACVTVGNDGAHVNRMLSQIVTWVETEGREVEVLDHFIEIL